MKKLLISLILLFCFLLNAGGLKAQKVFTVLDFQTEIGDTITLPKLNDEVNSFIPKANKDKLWQVYNDGKSTITRPLYHKGIVFPSNTLKYALDAKTGEKIFFGSKDAEKRFEDWEASFVCLRGKGSYSTNPIIVDIITGKIVETRCYENGSFETYLIKENTLIVEDNLLKLISLSDKTVLWEKENNFGRGSLVGEDLVLLPSKRGGCMYAFDKWTGEECWSLDLGSGGIMTFKLDDYQLYVGTVEGIYAIDLLNANEPILKWKYSKGYAMGISYDQERIYVFNERPYAIDKQNCQIAWKSEAWFFPGGGGDLSVTENYLIGRGEERVPINVIVDKRTGKPLGSTSYPSYNEELPDVPTDIYFTEFGEGDFLVGTAKESLLTIGLKLDYLSE